MESSTAHSGSTGSSGLTGSAGSAADAGDARADALGWAAAARQSRHGVRSSMGSGATTLSVVLDDAPTDDLLGRLRLLWVLESLPGARKIDTRRTLGRLGIDGDRALATLDDTTLRTVRETFAPDEVRS